MALSCIFTKRNEAVTYFVRGNKRLEDTVEFGRVHVLLVFTIILDHLGESRISMVHVINQVFKLRSRPADKGPHLLAILVVELHIGKVLCEFLADGLQTFAKLTQRLAHVLQIYYTESESFVTQTNGT